MAFNCHDYFNKFGFEDGDDVQQVALAIKFHDRFKELLSEELRRGGMENSVEAYYIGGIHNHHRVWIEGYGYGNSIDMYPLEVQAAIDRAGARLAEEA